MITKISLQSVASYGLDSPTTLETQKKINLIYGLNGTGKTTISNLLQSPDGSLFSQCSITTNSENKKTLVYNQQFVEDNFHQNTEYPGIFNLDTHNKEAEEQINNHNKRIQEIDRQLKQERDDEGNPLPQARGLCVDKENNEKARQNIANTLKKSFWNNVKREYGETDLSFCFKNKNTKDKLFEHILKFQSSGIKRDIRNLKKEARVINSSDKTSYSETDFDLVTQIDFTEISDIEHKTIFQESITGNTSAQVHDLIQHLNNSDWVKRGFDNYTEKPEHQNSTCPFCQKDTITSHLYEELSKYFDGKFQEKIDELQNIKNQYTKHLDRITNIKNQFLDINLDQDKKENVKQLFENLIHKLNTNNQQIEKKIQHPNKVIQLENSNIEHKKLNELLDIIKQEMQDYNAKIENESETKNQLAQDFWNYIVETYNSQILDYRQKTDKLDQEINNLQRQIDSLKKEKQELEDNIRELEKQKINIQIAVDHINNQLQLMGIEDFSIIPTKNNNGYKLQRNSSSKDTQFDELSEGERTIISFLYFLELCKGKDDQEDQTIPLNEKIIVIDDPVSSLSHIYTFNVAQLLKNEIFQKCKQSFVLTHNLYFFHELIKLTNHHNLFRITKCNNKSQIKTMDDNEIQNEYQTYWQYLKDHASQKDSNAFIANVMRNILEYFFSFVENKNYKEIIKSIDDSKYDYFIRYMNRESHSDFTNIYDLKDMDPEIFKEAFKQIFIQLGYENHYNTMMGNP